MAKRVIVSRQEVELTDEEAKQYILDKVFTGVGGGFQLKDFDKEAVAGGIEGNLEVLVNELIKEGKLRVEREWFHAGCAAAWIWVIRRIA